MTNNTNKFTVCFNNPQEKFSAQSNRFFKTLNENFHECFRKVRITNKSGKIKTDEVHEYLTLKVKLQCFLTSAKSPFTKKFINDKLEKLNKKIMQISSNINFSIVSDQIKQNCSPRLVTHLQLRGINMVT